MMQLTLSNGYNNTKQKLSEFESKYGISSVEFYDAYQECNTPQKIESHIADEWAKLCDRFILYGGFSEKNRY